MNRHTWRHVAVAILIVGACGFAPSVGRAANQAAAASAPAWHVLTRPGAAQYMPLGLRATVPFSGTTWHQRAEFKDPAGGTLGNAVAISGSTAAAGNPYFNSVSVYVRSGSTWSQQATLTATDSASSDEYGAALAMVGATLVVGAPDHAGTGAVYVYVQSGGVWSQQAELTLSGGHPQFGRAVALSRNTLLVGAQGAAYVFMRNGSAWTEHAILKASDGSPADNFGDGVALSGATALIGALDKNSSTGAAYIFVRSGSTWNQQAELTASDGSPGSGFGSTVALDGSTALIGAGGASAVYVFVGSGSTWTQQTKLPRPTTSTGFGTALALSGSTALIGAFRTTFDTGAAYVFVNSGGTWSQQATLTAADGVAGDHFGSAVGLSGATAIIGAPQMPAAYVFVRG